MTRSLWGVAPTALGAQFMKIFCSSRMNQYFHLGVGLRTNRKKRSKKKGERKEVEGRGKRMMGKRQKVQGRKKKRI